MRNESGIQDWERTPDGKKIDVKATELKSQMQKADLDTVSKTWTPSERKLERILSVNNPDLGPAERIISVNQSRQALTEYQNLMANNLWNPSPDTEKKFIRPVSLANSDPTNPQHSAFQYDLDALQTDKGYLQAKKYQNRIAAGETPVFVTEMTKVLNSNGTPIKGKSGADVMQESVVYDKDGVALIERWVNTKRETDIAELNKKQADAISAQAGAAFDQQYETLGRRADAAAKIQNAISQTPDPSTRAAGQAAIGALIKGGGPTPKNAGRFVPVPVSQGEGK
jgi:hypothetical protein